MNIKDILAKYETDKVNGHCYGDSYNEIFSRFDRNAPLNILEVGTQKGGSLLAWKEYFPNATVTGIDIVDVVKPEYRSSDINYIFCDIKDYKTDQVFDIIIDDGSHFLPDVLYVVNNFDYGLLIIEDVQDVEWVKSINVPHEVIDLRQVHGNYDDFLILCY
jgi:hypothetical protein